VIRYFTARELADRLEVPLARWKRWARDFLPPDPLGGLQSGYARHYSIDEAFTVHLAGLLVSRSKFSIPEARAILTDLDQWLSAEGYRTGSAAETPGETVHLAPVHEHLILIDRHPVESSLPSGFRYTIRAILARRQLTGQGRQIREERYRILRLGGGEADELRAQALEQTMIRLTRILQRFTGCLELDAHLFAALRGATDMP
jgi:hypothetical protein